MRNSGLPAALRWFLFVLAIGTLVSAGVYLRAFILGGAGFRDALRALLFLVLGVLFTLMFGENRSSPAK